MKKPSVLLGLVVLGMLGVSLRWLIGRDAEVTNLLYPWTPPELALAGVPAEPSQALRALAVHGDVPSCHVREKIEEGDHEEQMDHQHVLLPVEPIRGLEGSAEKILPYLGHPSEPVVYRAATLLCFIQDMPSRRSLAWLASRYPCRRWVRRVIKGAGISQAKADCPHPEEDGGYELLNKVPPATSQPSPWALALAQRISEGEPNAVRQALQATHAMELARRSEGLQALMNVSTVKGLALVLQAFLEAWEAEVLSIRTRWMDPKTSWQSTTLFTGVGGATLLTVAERTGRSREEVLVEAVGLLPESLAQPAYTAIEPHSPLYFALGRFARSPAGSEVKSVTARQFLEMSDRYTRGSDPQEIEAESRRITALFQARDQEALKPIAFSERGHPFHQTLAACYLVALGDEDHALRVLEQLPPMGLLEHNAIRSEVKKLLDGAKSGATRERLQRIYEKASERCRLNDCSVESPR